MSNFSFDLHSSSLQQVIIGSKVLATTSPARLRFSVPRYPDPNRPSSDSGVQDFSLEKKLSKDLKMSDSEYDSEFVAAQTAKTTKKPSTSSSSTTRASRKRKSTSSKDTKSDSEYDSEFVAAQTAKTTKKPSTSSSSTTRASRKRKSTSSKDTKSDSEYDSEFVAAQTAKSTKKPSTSSSSTTRASRKRKSTSSKDTKNKKSTTVDIFGLSLSEEVEVSQPKPTSLASHITYRVANKTQRRSAVTEGDFYVELKIYHRDDAESAAPEERWKKALLRTNCCLQSESSQFDHLQRFVREIHLLFKDSAPAFVGDKFK